jgi:hypothetical protein
MRRNSEALLFLFSAILFGGFVRLYPAWQAGFPLNDGGLFYQMILDLQKAHYSLPDVTTYNSMQIPFAYPPLAFYLTARLGDLLHVSILDLVRLLPAIISTITIPAFYLLANELTKTKNQVIFGTLAFALLPRAFAWQIMGGGITRSFGLLFALLTMLFALRFYRQSRIFDFLMCILFGTLVVLTHPEAAVITALSALFFYVWENRSVRGLLASLGIAASILALTSPWWSLILKRFGMEPFLAAMSAAQQDSINPVLGLFLFFQFLFTEEPFLAIFSVIGIIGLFSSLARKEPFLPIWLLGIQLLQPRGGPLFMMIPLALLVGHGLEAVILPALQPKNHPPLPDPVASQGMSQTLKAPAARYFLLFLFAYSIMSAYQTGLRISQGLSLQPSDVEAYQWVRDNTPPDSQFLLVTQQQPMLDAWSEWFPALTGRVSQATIFGFEWINDGKFGERISAYKNLQACARKDATCLENWSKKNSQPFSYVLIREQGAEALIAQLAMSNNYHLVYRKDNLSIFQNK